VDEQGNYWMRAVVETPEQKHAGNGNSKVHPPNSAPPIKKPRRPAVRRTPE
jgi:arginine decarboxylase